MVLSFRLSMQLAIWEKARKATFEPKCNPDLKPETALVAIDDASLEAEQELVKQNQAFSKEMLRLSLAAIIVIGFLLRHGLEKVGQEVRDTAANAVIGFGIAALLSLIYRSYSAKTLRLFVWALRFSAAGDRENAEACLKSRAVYVTLCIQLKFVAVLALGIAAFALAIAFKRALS